LLWASLGHIGRKRRWEELGWAELLFSPPETKNSAFPQGHFSPCLFIAYDLFNVLLNLVCRYFIENFGGGFELKASHLLGRHSTTWVTLPALFYVGVFRDRVSSAIFLDWLWTQILLISAAWIARMTDLSQRHLAFYWELLFLYSSRKLVYNFFVVSSSFWWLPFNLNLEYYDDPGAGNSCGIGKSWRMADSKE
jgi:hypothetical protein